MKRFSAFVIIYSSVFLTLFLCASAMAERWAVKVDKCNVRSGPGDNYDVVFQVEKYYPLDVLDSKGEWKFARDADGDEGWIHGNLLSKTETVVVVKDKSNIRSGPGTKNKVVFIVEKGTPFKVIDRKSKWIQIEHANGDKGWIYNTLVW